MDTEKRRCRFYLSSKRRFCANNHLPHSQFCGNHDPTAIVLRVPCPIDPSHSVLKDSLESHVKRCPCKKQAQALESQPYYSKGINADDDGSEEFFSSEAKRNYVYGITVVAFCDLVEKMKKIHSSVCGMLPKSYIMRDNCEKWLNQQRLDRQIPYQKKHALQQASILGNMEAFGILKKPEEEVMLDENDEFGKNCHELDGEGSTLPAVIEFGAGRGYLAQMLADCYGINKVFLVERRSYRLKADRSLRQDRGIKLERLRIDIEDLNLQGIESLRDLPYLAIGKHLCGPASDLMMKCCLPDNQNKMTSSSSCHLQGLALATCCHHLCQWKHYINKEFFSSFGITKEEFHSITWFSSWAVDADHSSELEELLKQEINLDTSGFEQPGSVNKRLDEITKQIPASERAALGFMCKEIIDTGRMLWLRERGLDAKLVKYIQPNFSPENHLLVAKRRIP